MSILLPALAVFCVAFAAFCVWLTVRIVNRRERWAKWTAVGLVVGLPLLYAASIGPAWWIWRRVGEPTALRTTLDTAYEPLWLGLACGPDWLFGEFVSYCMIGDNSPIYDSPVE